MNKASTAKNTSMKLLVASKGGGSPLPDIELPEIARYLMFAEDMNEAKKILADEVGKEFDIGEGADIEELKLEMAEKDELYRNSFSHLKKLESHRNNLKPDMASSKGADFTPFLKWRWWDQLSIGLIYGGVASLMFMSGSGVYANLISSGEPVFLENPLVAIGLSTLLPVSSLGLKYLPLFFDSPVTKKNYNKLLGFSTAILTTGWVVIFSQVFSGVGAGLDWDSLGEESIKLSSVLTVIQMMAELSLAALLFSVADRIHNRYAPFSIENDQEFIAADNAYKSFLEEFHEPRSKRRNEIHKQIIKLQKTRECRINKALAAFDAARSKINFLKNF